MQRERLHHLQERIHQAFEDADAGGDSFLVFQVGAELCAVEFKKISSVLACGQITQLWARYTMPNSVLGSPRFQCNK